MFQPLILEHAQGGGDDITLAGMDYREHSYGLVGVFGVWISWSML